MPLEIYLAVPFLGPCLLRLSKSQSLHLVISERERKGMMTPELFNSESKVKNIFLAEYLVLLIVFN